MHNLSQSKGFFTRFETHLSIKFNLCSEWEYTKMEEVFIALGGNIGNTLKIFQQALNEISRIKDVNNMRCSDFYQTSPVSPILQADFLNAVCAFHTILAPNILFQELQKIERKFGKHPKPKEAPRILDLDIILYGKESYVDGDLEIPHPRWMTRKFVLVPLSDLIEEIVIPDKKGKRLVNIRKMIELLPNSNNEMIRKVKE